jgi:hypothetical protein
VRLPGVGEGRQDEAVEDQEEDARPGDQDEPALSLRNGVHHGSESPIQRKVKVNWAGTFPLIASTFSPWISFALRN